MILCIVSSCVVLQEDPAAKDPSPPANDHQEYYGKGYRGPVSQNTQKPAKKKKKKPSKKKSTKPEPAKPQAGPLSTEEKCRTVIQEIDSDSESSESEESEVEETDETGQHTEATLEAALPVVNPQPVKLLPPPRPGMQAVEVCSFSSLLPVCSCHPALASTF